MPRQSILREPDAPAEINLSPMIDCIFILLIFFIVTTVFVEETGMQVNKPDVAASTPLWRCALTRAIPTDGRASASQASTSWSGLGSPSRWCRR